MRDDEQIERAAAWLFAVVLGGAAVIAIAVPIWFFATRG